MSQCSAGPLQRPGAGLLVHVVPGKNQTENIVEKVQKQKLQRCHREKGQEDAGNYNGEDVAEIGGRCDFDVLGHVGKGPAPLLDSRFQHIEILLQQDHICPFLDGLRCGVHGYAHIRLHNGRQVVHTVSQKAHGVSVGAQNLHNLYFLLGGQLGKQGGVLDFYGERILVQLLQFSAGQRLRGVNSQPPADREGDIPVIPGEYPYPHMELL